MSPKKDNTQELLTFLMKKHGGEQEVYKEFYGEQIVKLAEQGVTIKELRAEASDSGWLGMLDDMKVIDLVNIVKPDMLTAPSKPGKPSSGRLTKRRKQEVIKEALALLKEHPWSTSAELTRNIDIETRQLGNILRGLRKDGSLKTEGVRAAMRYALADEKSKP